MATAIVWKYVNLFLLTKYNTAYLPEYIDLDFLALYKAEFISKGLKNSVVYYEEYDFASAQYKSPVARVVWQTEFDRTKNPPEPTFQIKKISWRLSDQSWSKEKSKTLPIRNPKLFLQKMRSRIIEELIDLADKFGLADKLKALYENHSTEIYIYKEGGSPKFRDEIASSSEEWLSNPSTDGRTVRDVIMDYLAVGQVANNATKNN